MPILYAIPAAARGYRLGAAELADLVARYGLEPTTTVNVSVYPAGLRRKAVRSFPGALDGTSEANLNTYGRGLLEAVHNREGARMRAASPGTLDGVTVNGRTYSDGMRQSAYTSPLAPMRVSDGQWSGFGADSGDLMSTARDHEDLGQDTLFGTCSAIATHTDSPGTSFGMRGTYADGTRVLYDGQPIPDKQKELGGNRPSRRIEQADSLMVRARDAKGRQRWVLRSSLPSYWAQGRGKPWAYAGVAKTQGKLSPAKPEAYGHLWRLQHLSQGYGQADYQGRDWRSA